MGKESTPCSPDTSERLGRKLSERGPGAVVAMDNDCPDRLKIPCTSRTHIHFRYVVRSCVDANDRARGHRGPQGLRAMSLPSESGAHFPFGASNRRRVSLGKLPLMPVGIGGRHFAGSVQSQHLICRQTPTDSPQILLQLHFVSGTDNHCRYRRTL